MFIEFNQDAKIQLHFFVLSKKPLDFKIVAKSKREKIVRERQVNVSSTI